MWLNSPSSPIPTFLGLPLTFSSQSVIVSSTHVERTIRHCHLFMLQTISTFHLCIAYFWPFFLPASTPFISWGICLSVRACTIGKKIATLKPCWIWQGNWTQFQSHAEDVCSLFLVGNMDLNRKHTQICNLWSRRGLFCQFSLEILRAVCFSKHWQLKPWRMKN